MTEVAGSGPPPPPAGDAIIALCRAVSVVRGRVEREALRPRRMTWTTFEVLQLVLKHPHIRLHELATLTGAPKGTVMSAVRLLEARRLIVRHTPRDLRQVELQATSEGQRAANEMIFKVADVEARLMPNPQLRRTIAAVAHQFHHPPVPPDRTVKIP